MNTVYRGPLPPFSSPRNILHAELMLGTQPSNRVMVTGAAGFIGFHVAKRLMEAGREVVGVDCFTPYYDLALKNARFAELLRNPLFTPEVVDLAAPLETMDLFARHRPRHVIHLAAQPGVRHSIDHPVECAVSNIMAFLMVLEASRYAEVEHLVYASSSSVYGADASPFCEDQSTDAPVSLYAATKKSNEVMAHAYSRLFGLPATGLRFFTVYGPWGRPDMAIYKFVRAIAEGSPIDVANGGRVWRDFTYVDDVAECVIRITNAPPATLTGVPDAGLLPTPHRIYNIGTDRPEELNALIALIEEQLGCTAVRRERSLPLGDVTETHADLGRLRRDFGFAPRTRLRDGLARFIAWYKRYHGDEMLEQSLEFHCAAQ
jgi:UDP-glucuronate 4-epimerase